MNPNQLFQTALDANHLGSTDVILIMPGQWSKQDYRYLAGKNSPRGEILGEMPDGIAIAFNALDIIAYCVAQYGYEVELRIEKPRGEPMELPAGSKLVEVMQ